MSPDDDVAITESLRRQKETVFKTKKKKMQALILVLVFSPLFLLAKCSEEDDLYLSPDFTSIDRSNYVDPHDMLNYNPKEIQKEKGLLKTSRDENIPQSLTTPGQTVESRDRIEEGGVPNQVDISEKAINKSMPEFLNHKPANCSSHPKNTTLDIPFLGRFVKVLSTVLQLKVGDNKVCQCSSPL